MLPSKKSIVIEKGRVVSVQDSDITQIIVDDKEIGFPSGYVFPSFVESHAHIIGQGEKLVLPDISQCSSFSHFIKIAKQTETRKGDWLFLRGWNEENWIDCRVKDYIGILDKEFPDTPVCLVRIDGHAMFVNSAAIEISSIDITIDPPGGLYEKDSKGNFTGLVIDTAMEPIYKAIPEHNKQQLLELIENSLNDYFSKGVTEIHDMDVYLRYLPLYSELAQNDRLPIKIKSYIRGFDDRYEFKYPYPFKIGILEICGLKFYADGALGSRGALLFDEYSDYLTKGLELISSEELYLKSRKACEKGWEIAVHAIGDAAVKNVINAFIRLREDGFQNNLRIEHSQIVKPEHIAFYKKYNIIPSIQAIHCTSDSSMAVDRLGNRIDYAYPWKSFINNDIEIISGSDAPIESNSVIEGINALVNRIPDKQVEKWNYDEKISIEDALASYTKWPRNVHSEGKKDTSIEDQIISENSFVILNNDFESTDSESILSTQILATVANGKIFYPPEQSARP